MPWQKNDWMAFALIAAIIITAVLIAAYQLGAVYWIDSVIKMKEGTLQPALSLGLPRIFT
jgi:hypothetical protein